jgi:hypothetical protein
VYCPQVAATDHGYTHMLCPLKMFPVRPILTAGLLQGREHALGRRKRRMSYRLEKRCRWLVRSRNQAATVPMNVPRVFARTSYGVANRWGSRRS